MSSSYHRLPDDLARLVDPSLLDAPAELTVAAYTAPIWHRSALYDRLYAPGWTEYVLMEGARPWFPGHHQPRQPLLGALDERDPATWERYIELAASHGVDVLIWDWYWYADEPALHEALEDGFLRARNLDDVRFAVMWTNHDWQRLFPDVHADGARSYAHAHDAPQRIEDIRRSMSYLIARYFHLPSYWRIDGKPVLVVYDTDRLLRVLGFEGTRTLLAELREHARNLGHEGIHFHADCVLAVALGSPDPQEAIADVAGLGFDTYGLYNSIVVSGLRRPVEEELPQYGIVAADVVRDVWPQVDAASELPFLPAVSPGWDGAPRFNELRRRAGGNRNEWPGTLVVVDETPGAFEAFLRAAFAFMNARPGHPRILTIGCWNEWTEGQYILPDVRLGFGMLHALARAVGRDVQGVRYASPGGDPWPGESGLGPKLTG